MLEQKCMAKLKTLAHQQMIIVRGLRKLGAKWLESNGKKEVLST